MESKVYKKENTTGIKVGEGVKKALEWLLLIAPHTKRVFVPVKFDTRAAQSSLDDLKDASAKLHVDLLVTVVEGPDDLKASWSSIPKDIDAVFILHSLLIVSNPEAILETAAKGRLPTASGSGLYKHGVTISYGQDHGRTGQQASKIAHKVLQGYSAASLPFETADMFPGINLNNARTIGLEIPEHILKQAEIVESSGTALNN